MLIIFLTLVSTTYTILYDIGELTSASTKERMTTNIILWVLHPLNFIDKQLIASCSKICTYLPMLTQSQSIKEREEYEKHEKVL